MYTETFVVRMVTLVLKGVFSAFLLYLLSCVVPQVHAEFDTPSPQMFQQLGWLSVPNRIKYNKAILTYRALNDMTPEYISKLTNAYVEFKII